MRLAELRLLAFGHFTDAVVDLDAAGPALHVVYGHNEAGKSTTLRALTGLFFGIPTRTRDGFLHPMPKLRVGARLIGEDDEVHDVVRKKGNKNTLLGVGDAPIDEGVMRSLLAHVGEEQFRRMFGLDHETLREGAAELLSSGGDVGESLYGASLGGGIHALVTSLDEEAKAIFTTRGQRPELNAALADYKEAQKHLRDAGFTPEGYKTQGEAIAEARAEVEALRALRRALHGERGRVERAVRVLPRFANYELLSAERAELGDVPHISAQKSEERIETQRAHDHAQLQLDTLRGEQEQRQARRNALPEVGSIVEVRPEALTDLTASYNVYRKNRDDLSNREAEREAARRDVQRILRGLGAEVGADEARGLLLSNADRDVLQRLVTQHGELSSDVSNARDSLEEAETKLAELEAPGVDEEATDVSVLAAALDVARPLTGAPGDLAALAAETNELLAAVERRATALAGFAGDAEAAAGLAVPTRDEVERAADERRDLERCVADARAALDTAGSALSALERDLAADARRGRVPSDEDLRTERAERDRLWSVLRHASRDPAREESAQTGLDWGTPDPDRYEGAVRTADETADTMRREADRVARRAQLEAERAEAEDAVAARAEALEAAEVSLAAHDESTRTRWAKLGVEAPDAETMRKWLPRHQELLDAYTRVEERRADHAKLGARVEDALATLRAALGAEGETLNTLMRRAAALVEDARTQEVERAQRERQRKETLTAVARLRKRLEKREAALGTWATEWGARVTALGLTAEARPDHVSPILNALVELEKSLDAADAAQARIDKMDGVAERFEKDVDELVATHAPELESLPIAERAGELIDRVAAAHETRAQATELDRELAERAEKMAGLEGLVAQSGRGLAALCDSAGVRDVEALEAAERCAERARKMDEDLESVRRELLDAGDNLSLEALAQEIEGLDIGEQRGRKAELEREIPQLDEEVEHAASTLRDREYALTLYEKRANAAEAADDAAAVLAKVQGAAHRYVRLRLAREVLRAEIARYREENQGPILERANALFPRLTMGAYVGLRVGFGEGDTPVLCCVRPNGEEVLIAALSDGTKDQLYLALRLSSLLRFAEHNAPLPLILDDCLVHFDDDRARAALEVLGEVSTSFQILFFTHHARLVELAREAVPRKQLRVCELGATKSEGPAPVSIRSRSPR